MLRVISGALKGRRLKAPNGLNTRPTPAIVREALMSILGEKLSQAKFLDLYAGTGSVGIEALSCGAEFCSFVEKDKNALKCLRENVLHLGIENETNIINGKVEEIIPRLNRESFDVVYLGPPYAINNVDEVFQLIMEHFFMGKNPILIFQHLSKDTQIPPFFSLEKRRRYGDTTLSFFRTT